MELATRIQVQELPEGLFLATSDEVPGLVAQGRTVSETVEIARDVARKLIEASRGRDGDQTCRRPVSGNHEIWFNPGTNRYTTVPNHPGDMPEATLRAILRQAGIEPDHFLRC